MNKYFKQISQVTALSALVCAGASYAQEADFSLNQGRAAAFALPAINTGLVAPAILGGLTINTQVTHPNVFVFPAENQQWFTTVRTCFNPMLPFSGFAIGSSLTTSLLGAAFPVELISALSVTISGLGTPANIGGFIGPTLTSGIITGGLFNLLTGVVLPSALGSVTVDYEVYNDAGTSVKTLNGVIIPANGCDMHTSDVTADPLFLGLPAGVYTVVATGDSLFDTEDGLRLGFLTGSSNSTGRNVLKALHMEPKADKKGQ